MANRLPPTEIECKNLKFLITDVPTLNNTSAFINILREYNVTSLVRLSSSTLVPNDFELELDDISVYNLLYEDGGCPNNNLVKEWFNLLKKHIKTRPDSCIAVQCSAGFGRAPMMVALALMELGLQFEDAVELIREKRKGALNTSQLRFLKKYRRKSRLKLNENKPKCIII